jgi:hypothetical protein
MRRNHRPEVSTIGTTRRIEAFVCLIVSVLCGLVSQASAQETVTRIAPFPASSKVIHRIAFGSCAKHWQHQSIWDAVIAKKPDLFLFLGDAIYADTDGTTAWSVTEEQVEIDWAAEPSPLIAIETVDVNGSIRFEHRVSLSALRATD